MQFRRPLAIPFALLVALGGCATTSGTTEPSSPGRRNGSSQSAGNADPGASVIGDHCGGGLMGVTVLPDSLADRRRGARVTRFSDLATTRDTPIEVCGVRGQVVWLTDVRCADGSNPFHSLEHAHASRAGNVGPGEPCGHIIDLYEVPCPERTYEVYMDLYVCTESEGVPY